MKVTTLVSATVLAAGLLVTPAPALANDNSRSDHAVRVAVLTGEQETSPGDADGVGVAVVHLNLADSRVCSLIAAVKLDGTVTAAHIHRGPVGVAGPVVVALAAPVDHVARGCATVAPELAADIAANSAGYYVNVHTSQFPAGAVRGQLGR